MFHFLTGLHLYRDDERENNCLMILLLDSRGYQKVNFEKMFRKVPVNLKNLPQLGISISDIRVHIVPEHKILFFSEVNMRILNDSRLKKHLVIQILLIFKPGISFTLIYISQIQLLSVKKILHTLIVFQSSFSLEIMK